MFDDDEPEWSLLKHMEAGQKALAKLACVPAATLPQPVCHHFSELSPVDPVHVSMAKTYAPLVHQFKELGLAFEPDRLEAWERLVPDKSWLDTVVPALVALAEVSALRYQGWSWEPSNGQPVCATDFLLIDNQRRSSEG